MESLKVGCRAASQSRVADRLYGYTETMISAEIVVPLNLALAFSIQEFGADSSTD